MALVLPYTIAPGDPLDADRVQGNFATLAQRFNGGITDADISGSAAIQATKLQASSITNSQMAPQAIGTAQLADSNVTTIKLADLSVSTPKLADICVTTAKIFDGAVTSVKIPDGTITNAKLAGLVALDKINILTETITTTSDAAGTGLVGSAVFTPAVHVLLGIYCFSFPAANCVTTCERQTGSGSTFFFHTTKTDGTGPPAAGSVFNATLTYIRRT